MPTSTAPELGQDTETTLLELGYTWDDVIDLKEQGAII
jgi:crotonobetainyl-CoA:carnitine CoA-transferase CaiB-like acyl-CoA transferase